MVETEKSGPLQALERLSEELLIARGMDAKEAHKVALDVWAAWRGQPASTQNTELVIIELLEASNAAAEKQARDRLDQEPRG